MNEPSTPEPAPFVRSEDENIKVIQGLFRKAGAAANKAEQDLFLTKAQQLMLKYKIDKVRFDSAEAEESRKNRPITIVERDLYTKRQRYETDQYIARIVRTCWHVQVLWSTDRELVTTKRKVKRPWETEAKEREFTRWKDRLIYCLVGDQADVDFVFEIIDEMHKMMRHLLAAHLRNRGEAWSGDICHSFFEGFRHAFMESNKREEAKALAATEKQVQDQYALVLVDKEKAAQEYITQNICTVRSRATGARSSCSDSQAFSSGLKAGKSAKVGTKKLK